MKVHLKRSEEKRGMLRKTTWYKMDARIELDADEAAIVKEHKIGKLVFMEITRPWEKDELFNHAEFDVSDVISAKGFWQSAPELGHVNRWEEEFKEKCRGLKSTIEKYGETGGEKEEVFEL